jgi:hypothetical protein
LRAFSAHDREVRLRLPATFSGALCIAFEPEPVNVVYNFDLPF